MKLNGNELANKSKMWAEGYARKLTLGRHIVDELAQEAALGILRAAEKYDARRDHGAGFWRYAQTWANAFMSRHVNKLGGPVNYKTRMPVAVSLVNEPDGGGHYDDRTVEGHQFEQAAMNEAMGKLDAGTALMVEAKMAGATNEEIANRFVVSREFVRKRICAFMVATMGEP